MTLKLKKTICDVDLFVSNSLNQLIQNSFKTDGLLFPLSNNAACFVEKMNTNLIISFHVFLLLVLRLRRFFFQCTVCFIQHFNTSINFEKTCRRYEKPGKREKCNNIENEIQRNQ